MKKLLLFLCAITLTVACGKHRDPASQYFMDGCKKAEQNDFANAIIDYTKAIHLNTDYSFAYLGRANAKMALGDYHGARADCDKALAADPTCSDAVVKIMAEQKPQDNNNPQQNVNNHDGETIKKGNEKEVEQYIMSGQMKESAEDFSGAITDYNKALNLSPGLAEIYADIGEAKIGLRDFYGAIQYLNKAIALDANDATYYWNRAYVKYSLEDLADALDDINKAIALKPDFGQAYLLRGLVKFNGKLADNGCADFNKANELGNKDAQAVIDKYCK